MNTNRNSKSITGLALIIVVLIALQACSSLTTARENRQQTLGMGDLHRYEAQGYLPGSAEQASNPATIGMGDLHRYETEAYVPGTAARASNRDYVGMGDLHRYEALQEARDAGKVQSLNP